MPSKTIPMLLLGILLVPARASGVDLSAEPSGLVEQDPLLKSIESPAKVRRPDAAAEDKDKPAEKPDGRVPKKELPPKPASAKPTKPKEATGSNKKPAAAEQKKDDRVQQDPLLKSLESPAKKPRAATPARDRAAEKLDSQVQQDPLLKSVEPADDIRPSK